MDNKLVDLEQLHIYTDLQKKNKEKLLQSVDNNDLIDLGYEIQPKYVPGYATKSGNATISDEGIATTFTSSSSWIYTGLTNQVLANDWEIQVKYKSTSAFNSKNRATYLVDFEDAFEAVGLILQADRIRLLGFYARGSNGYYTCFDQYVPLGTLLPINHWYICRVAFDGNSKYTYSFQDENYKYIPVNGNDITTINSATRLPMNRTGNLILGNDTDGYSQGITTNHSLFIDLKETYIKAQGKLVSKWSI